MIRKKFKLVFTCVLLIAFFVNECNSAELAYGEEVESNTDICEFNEKLDYDIQSYTSYSALPKVVKANVQHFVAVSGISRNDVLGYIIYRNTCLVSKDTTETGYHYNVQAFECEMHPVCVNAEKGIYGYPIMCELCFSLPTVHDIYSTPELLDFARKSSKEDSYSITLPLKLNIKQNSEDNEYTVTKNLTYQANALYCRKSFDISQHPDFSYTYSHYGDREADSWIHGKTYVSGLENFYSKKDSMNGTTLSCQTNLLFGADYFEGDKEGTTISAGDENVLCNIERTLIFSY